MVTTQKKQTGTSKAKQARDKTNEAGNTTKGPRGRRTVEETENVEQGPAAEGSNAREDAAKAKAAKIVLDPPVVSIGSPVKIHAPGTEGPIYVTGMALDQTVEPDLDRNALATFQHSGEAEVKARKAKGRGWVKAQLTVR